MITVERTDKGYYNAKEEGGKIATLSAGNSKVKSLCWSLLPGTKGTCAYNCKGCYASKNYVNKAPAVRDMRKRNTEASRRFDFVNVMTKMIQRAEKDLSPRYVRVHDSGDFESYYSILDWIKITQNCPDSKFLAYTKRYDAVYTALNLEKLPENLNIILSIMPDTPYENMIQAIETSYIHDLPIAYSDKYTDYSRMIEEKLRHKFTTDCTYDNCAECNRICWNLKESHRAVHFYRH